HGRHVGLLVQAVPRLDAPRVRAVVRHLHLDLGGRREDVPRARRQRPLGGVRVHRDHRARTARRRRWQEDPALVRAPAHERLITMASRPAQPARDPAAKTLLIARLERRFHIWRERRARKRGRVPQVVPFPGYGGDGWIRVVGRVLILPSAGRNRRGGGSDGVRGWRAFLGIAVAYATVTVRVGDETHEVIADRGGVVDAVLPVRLAPGWQTFEMSVEGGESATAHTFVVDPSVRFGVVSDVDDTVMVTALPRPLLAAWNSFVLNEHARQPVPGMAVL